MLRRIVLTLVAMLVCALPLAGGAYAAGGSQVWVQSFERASQDEPCTPPGWQSPWQDSWDPAEREWRPAWEQWANGGKGGWTCTRSITWAHGEVEAPVLTDDGPMIMSLGPGNGPPMGGTTVVITGSGFTDVTSVLFGASAATFVINSDSQLTATSPAGSGSVDVTVSSPRGDSTMAHGFSYETAITGVSPSTGTTLGGTAVTITGTGFTAATSVSFGSTAATSFVIVSDTQITATTAVSAAGAVNVSVVTPTGTATSAAGFTFVVLPAVTTVSPSTGYTGGATTVTITGSGFTGATGVSFGGVAATSFTVDSDTSITATTPARGPGAVAVAVTNGAGSGSLLNSYTYSVCTISSISPTSGPNNGGYQVTVNGQGLSTTLFVRFGGVNASMVVSGGPTQVFATAPAHATGTVDIEVVVSGTTACATLPNAFTFFNPPS